MDERFERLVKMAREEFGVTIVKATKQGKTTFESLFGISSETIDQFEIPYNNSTDPFVFYYEEPPVIETESFEECLVTVELNFLAA